MPLSTYHQNYADHSDEEIKKRAHIKEKELCSIFKHVSLKTSSEPVRVAIMGCGDKRFIGYHKKIFEQVLERMVEITTFDITIEHLLGEPLVFQHDCTLPFPNGFFDITYGHILLKFIETKKQLDVLINSFEALNSGGIAIHVCDWEEIKAPGPKLSDGLWAVPLGRWKDRLTKLGIEYKEVLLEYGLALVLIK
jgi:hypothetical protein